MTIDQPGIYDIPPDQYHGDPVPGGSLSATGARRILTSPARFRWQQLNPEEHKHEFDMGHAAHKLILEVGLDIVEVKFDSWRTKAAQTAQAEAYAEGKTPLLTKDVETVHAMADAIREHELASTILTLCPAVEQTIVWRDHATGVWRRGMLDLLGRRPDGRRLIVDYKTTTDASYKAISKSVVNFGYHQQADWYKTGITALEPDSDPVFLFIFQERTAPYLVRVVELDKVAMDIGRELNRRALLIYKDCVERDEWPGYGDDITLMSVPAWYENRHLQEME